MTKKKKEPVKKTQDVIRHVTSGTDAKGRLVDYIRHEPCKGHGCEFCNGLGFTKQFVLSP